jgi:hypothetical protein
MSPSSSHIGDSAAAKKEIPQLEELSLARRCNPSQGSVVAIQSLMQKLKDYAVSISNLGFLRRRDNFERIID